jgi:hypothetical protein
VCLELREERRVRVERGLRDDGKLLQPHGVANRLHRPVRYAQVIDPSVETHLEMVHGINKLRVHIVPSARVGRLGVDDVCAGGRG